MLFVYIPWFVLGDEILVTFNLLAANFTFFTLYRITLRTQNRKYICLLCSTGGMSVTVHAVFHMYQAKCFHKMMLYCYPIGLSWIFMLLLHSMFCCMTNQKTSRVTKILSWVLSLYGNQDTEGKKCSSGERRWGRNSTMQLWVYRTVYLLGGQQWCSLLPLNLLLLFPLLLLLLFHLPLSPFPSPLSHFFSSKVSCLSFQITWILIGNIHKYNPKILCSCCVFESFGASKCPFKKKKMASLSPFFLPLFHGIVFILPIWLTLLLAIIKEIFFIK